MAVVFFQGNPLLAWADGDVVGRDVAACFLRGAGWGSVEEIARIVDMEPRTLYRSWGRYSEQGAAGLVRKRRGFAAGSRFDAAQDAAIKRYFLEGMTYREISRACSCSPGHVGDVVNRLGLKEDRAQTDLPMAPPTAPAPPPATPQPTPPATPPAAPVVVEAIMASIDSDPFYRVADRALAHAGLLQDAPPLFAPGSDLPWVGALLAVPGIVASGLIEEGQRFYPHFGPAFYGIRTTLLCSTLLFLLRIPRAENLKEWQPTELGRIIGLDRVPEIGTLRRKLRLLAQGPCERWNDAVVRRRLSPGTDDPLAWLYVDGHVRVYSGGKRLPATHVARMRISRPAVQDIWVHDAEGAPVLFVTQEAHPSLTHVLEPILQEVDDVAGRRGGTVVFDRGGWSPELFSRLIKAGYHILTYRKGASEALDNEHWEEVRAPDDSETWSLSDLCLRVGRPGVPMRQVTLRQGDHRTEILTTRMDLPAVEVAARMFARWTQENFFKYMRDEFDIDGLVEYGEQEEDPERETPNPDWVRLEKKVRAAKIKLGHAHRRGKETHTLRAELEALETMRNGFPRRIRVGDMKEPTVRLPARRQGMVTALKVAAWHVETGLVSAIAPHWKREPEEGRTLIAAALRSRGSLAVKNGELRVTLAAQSIPNRTRVLEKLCAILDETRTVFPGTNLLMRFAVDASTQWGARTGSN